MSVAEALAAGLPVVVTDGTPWSHVEALGIGRAVAQQPRAIAEAIIDVLANPADGCAMGARGKTWARDTFGWDAIGRSMRDAYQLALDRTRSSRA
jgi:glycosyltransferase involved in cell wall biosynthesis